VTGWGDDLKSEPKAFAAYAGVMSVSRMRSKINAMQLKKPGEAIRAIETIAKLCGLWKEKPDAQNQFNGPVTFEVHYTRESVSNEPHPHTIELQARRQFEAFHDRKQRWAVEAAMIDSAPRRPSPVATAT
jgi:hypothetical protein